MPKTVKAIVTGTPKKNNKISAEVDEKGRPYLSEEEWQSISIPVSYNNKETFTNYNNNNNNNNNFVLPSWISNILSTLYGNIPASELFRVFMLSGTLFFIIGGYWLLRSLKDPVISSIVGVEYIPKAKMCSLVVVFIFVFIYNHLIDIYPKYKLFYIIGGFYTCVFAIISFLLADPDIGIKNTTPDPDRLLGWISYFAIESFGSLGVSLFWSFTNSIIDLEGAKSAYGLIIAGAQIGSILGPTIAATSAESIGVPALYGIGALSMFLMVCMVFLYTKIFGTELHAIKNDKELSINNNDKNNNNKKNKKKDDIKKKKTGILEGFKLIYRFPYIRGILVISALFMVEVTYLDYTMKYFANNEFRTRYPDDPELATKSFSAFMGRFGQVTNGISFLFSLIGTSFIIRNLGLNKTLLAFPIICMLAALTVFSTPNLWIVFIIMMVLKAMSYALNNPCKEMCYQPTSLDVKFKCKSWIDTFGARSAKAAGSILTDHFRSDPAGLVKYGTGTSILVASYLIYNARWMGKKFDEFIESGYIVGDEENDKVPIVYSALDNDDDDDDIENASKHDDNDDDDDDSDDDSDDDDDDDDSDDDDDDDDSDDDDDDENNKTKNNQNKNKKDGSIQMIDLGKEEEII